MALAKSENDESSLIPFELLSVRHPQAKTLSVDVEVDARHLACPMPLLKAKQALKSMTQGQILRLLATDPGSLRDLVSYAHLSQHLIVGFFSDRNEFFYLIRKQTP